MGLRSRRHPGVELLDVYHVDRRRIDQILLLPACSRSSSKLTQPARRPAARPAAVRAPRRRVPRRCCSGAEALVSERDGTKHGVAPKTPRRDASVPSQRTTTTRCERGSREPEIEHEPRGAEMHVEPQRRNGPRATARCARSSTHALTTEQLVAQRRLIERTGSSNSGDDSQTGWQQMRASQARQCPHCCGSASPR